MIKFSVTKEHLDYPRKYVYVKHMAILPKVMSDRTICWPFRKFYSVLTVLYEEDEIYSHMPYRLEYMSSEDFLMLKIREKHVMSTEELEKAFKET